MRFCWKSATARSMISRGCWFEFCPNAAKAKKQSKVGAVIASLCCLSIYELPAVEVFDGSAIGSTVPARAGNAGFEHTSRPERVCRNALKRYLQPTAPAGVMLARVCPDVHVNEPLPWRSLYKGSAQGSHTIRDSILYRRLKFKGHVVSIRPLLLNRLVRAAAAPLQCEINACGRLLDNDSKREPLNGAPAFVPEDWRAHRQRVYFRCGSRWS